MIETVKKHRIFVLTDIENEPDDAMSLVRFLTYSNQWDIEGIVATTSIHLKNKTAAWRIHEILDAYAEVVENLNKHESGYPSKEQLLSVVAEGLPLYGMEGVGEGKDSSGSNLLMKAIEKEDERPIWVLVWGGPNVLAQALWGLKEKNEKNKFDKMLSKIRVYTISDQDDSGPWMRKEFPELFYIASPGFHDGGAYHHCTWSGISGDYFHGRFTGADFEMVDNPWLDKHIREKGPLGNVYPQVKYLMEGDTPTFLYLVDNGLGVSEHPEWGSWGGRYELYIPPTKKWFMYPETRPLFSDVEDEVMGLDGRWHTSAKASIWRWREAYQNDFSARMDWTIKSYEEANHPPVPSINHPAELTAKAGEKIELSAEGSYDPDGDELEYHWFCYEEAGTFSTSNSTSGNPIPIHDCDKKNAWIKIPKDHIFKIGTIHVILEVSDTGVPKLTRYKRVIINVTE
jgi:hypothetical protein